ncbi:Short-chain dehydrogenase [Paracoccus halophilus]|uniref:Short-chain dehydrogenase n=1 Tax=Paracoccus halophilus TaxID=376733 RepID=A0A099F6F8_9RHOB|nr:SDR family NAD(P)-dependent oxidoreductase [Paracoccus halophilus]KGJ05836.1 short-chain dehydrogenase [Paracoccus halophilus]SFA40806.1 Short-chain dehydrogenase [Paracoccus halophilus]
MDFAGRRIWIIGASAGIGAALARALADRGARLVLSARDAGALDRLATECGGARVLALDLARAEALAEACDALAADAPLDAVICTAALYDPGRVADLDPARAEAMVRVNILGMMEVARLCPPLLRDGGQLLLFGSVAGYLGLPGGQPYSATKAAVNNLAESLAVELAPRIEVKLVCPGFVRTRLTAKNRFTMPAIITPEEAAGHVLRGMSRRGFEIHFPRRFTLAVKLLRILPYALSLRITGRMG